MITPVTVVYLARTMMTISTISRMIPHAIADLILENFIRLRFGKGIIKHNKDNQKTNFSYINCVSGRDHYATGSKNEINC